MFLIRSRVLGLLLTVALVAGGHWVADGGGHPVVFASGLLALLAAPAAVEWTAAQLFGYRRATLRAGWFGVRVTHRDKALRAAHLAGVAGARTAALLGLAVTPWLAGGSDLWAAAGTVGFAGVVLNCLPVAGSAAGDFITAAMWRRSGSRLAAQEQVASWRRWALAGGMVAGIGLVAAGTFAGLIVAVGVLVVAVRTRNTTTGVVRRSGRMLICDVGVPPACSGWDGADSGEVAYVAADDDLLDALDTHPEVRWLVGCDGADPITVVGPEQLRAAASAIAASQLAAAS